MAVSTRSEMTCSQLAGLEVGVGPGQAQDVGQEPLGQAVAAHDTLGQRRARSAVRRIVRAERDQAFGLHAADHLRHRGPGDAEPLGDPRLDDVDVVLVQLEDGLAVLLERRVVLLRAVRPPGASAGDGGVVPPADRPVPRPHPPVHCQRPSVQSRRWHQTDRTRPPRHRPARPRWSSSRLPVASWFATSFAEPTAAQVGAWGAHRRRGPHAAVRAHRLRQDARRVPVGDRPPDDSRRRGCSGAGRPGVRVIYVSPLRALAVDIEKNLRSPTRGIASPSERLGGLRRTERRRAHRRHHGHGTAGPGAHSTGHPHHHTRVALPDAHLGSARDPASASKSVIIDEIHALAPTKRGAAPGPHPRAARAPRGHGPGGR